MPRVDCKYNFAFDSAVDLPCNPASFQVAPLGRQSGRRGKGSERKSWQLSVDDNYSLMTKTVEEKTIPKNGEPLPSRCSLNGILSP